MTAIQLEFNIGNNTESELKFMEMQKKIDAMHESMNKVRKKLFAKIGEVEKICFRLQEENMHLKTILGQKNETIYTYEKEGCLFDVSECKEVASGC